MPCTMKADTGRQNSRTPKVSGTDYSPMPLNFLSGHAAGAPQVDDIPSWVALRSNLGRPTAVPVTGPRRILAWP